MYAPRKMLLHVEIIWPEIQGWRKLKLGVGISSRCMKPGRGWRHCVMTNQRESLKVVISKVALDHS